MESLGDTAQRLGVGEKQESVGEQSTLGESRDHFAQHPSGTDTWLRCGKR